MDITVITKLASEAKENTEKNISRLQAAGAHAVGYAASLPSATGYLKDAVDAFNLNGGDPINSKDILRRHIRGARFSNINNRLLTANALYTLGMGEDVNENVHRGINTAALGAGLASAYTMARNPNRLVRTQVKDFGRYAAPYAAFYGANEITRSAMRGYNNKENSRDKK